MKFDLGHIHKKRRHLPLKLPVYRQKQTHGRFPMNGVSQ